MQCELETKYLPPSKEEWQGRKDPEENQRFYEVIKLHNLLKDGVPKAHKGIALLGFASDEGVKRNFGRIGAAQGPTAFRKAFAPLPSHLNSPFFDCGTVVCMNGKLEAAQESISSFVRNLRKNHLFPLLIGGGHEIAWANYKGLFHATSSPISILNIDAHFDFRKLTQQLGSSGTSFTQIKNLCDETNSPFSYLCLGIQKTANTKALFERAKKQNVSYITADELTYNTKDASSKVNQFIAQSDQIQLTICLDVFASFAAPGVSAPQPLGLFPREIFPYLSQIMRSNKVIGLDIAELNPLFDEDDRTAKLAAHLVASLLEIRNKIP